MAIQAAPKITDTNGACTRWRVIVYNKFSKKQTWRTVNGDVDKAIRLEQQLKERLAYKHSPLDSTLGSKWSPTIADCLQVVEVWRDKYSSVCFYCGSDTDHFQMDHFPIPARCHGVLTVRVCAHCHNIKDRLGSSVFADYLVCHLKDLEATHWSVAEGLFLRGKRMLDNTELWYLLDDWCYYAAVSRLQIARRLREWMDDFSTDCDYQDPAITWGAWK